MLSTVGVAVSLAMSLALGRALSGLLFGVDAADPPTLALASGVLLSAALVAAWIPARRFSSVDAAISLRE